MIWRVEVRHKEGVFDSHSESTKKNILDLGISSISKVEALNVYNLEGDLAEKDVEKICQDLLADKITHQFSLYPLNKLLPIHEGPDVRIVEIAYHPGVTDPVESSTIKGIKDLGIQSIQSVRTAKKYLLYGVLSAKELDTIVNRVLSNKLIQHVVDYAAPVK